MSGPWTPLIQVRRFLASSVTLRFISIIPVLFRRWPWLVLASLLAVVCALAQPVTSVTAEVALQQGADAAKSGDLARAAAILSAAQAQFPGDARLPVELAGIAFLQKDYETAKLRLHQARKLGSTDPFVNEFLGTLYLLDGNVEAALVLWNASAGPQLAAGQWATGLEGVLQPSLAARALPFPSGSQLSLDTYLRANRVLALLDICSQANFLLDAEEGGSYSMSVRCLERPGFGKNIPSSALMLARGLGYQAIHLRHANLGHRAISVTSLFRWDAQKRRAWGAVAMPLQGNPAWRLRLDADARHEHWRMLSPQNRDLQQAFLLRRVEAGIALAAVLGSRVTWENRLSWSNRSFTVAAQEVQSAPGTNLPPVGSAARLDGGAARLDGGSAIQYRHSAEADLIRAPLRRIVTTISGEASVMRFPGLQRTAGQQRVRLQTTWDPQAKGRDGRVSWSLHAGATQGNLPLTELYQIGLERDGAVPLRGHVGTYNGHKGSALYGDRYAVMNVEVEKQLIQAGLWHLRLVPFADAGWVRDAAGPYGARKLQFDAGVQLVAATASGTELRLSYGWNFRQKRSAFYVWSEPFP